MQQWLQSLSSIGTFGFLAYLSSTLFERFQIAENDVLRSRIAELENTNNDGEEPMHIDAGNDDVVILEATWPNSAVVTNTAVAKKVSI